MNYLALGQRLALECGVSGQLTTMQGQTGSLGRIVQWVAASWEDIQTLKDDWNWMRSSQILGAGVSFAPAAAAFNAQLGTGPTQVGVSPANFGSWVPGSFRNYVTSVGNSSEIYMDDIDFDVWRNGYMYGAQRQVQTRPIVISFSPDKSLSFGPPSNGLYTITGDYFMAPTVMTNDTDVPAGLQAQYHVAIVAKGMMMYGEYESAPEVLDRGTRWFNSLIARLSPNNTPPVGFGGSLDA